MKKNILLFIIFLSISFSTFCQTYNFKSYTIEQGLPQSTVFSIVQDSRNYLWTGTENGISRFDGSSFTTFDRSNGLPGNNVRATLEDKNGLIWVGTDKGIAVFDGKTWTTIGSKDGLKGSTILKLTEDNNGRIWAATNDSGINIITPNKNIYSIENINQNNGLSGNFVLDIFHDRNNKTWLAIIGGLNVIEYKNNKPQITAIEKTSLLPSKYISCVSDDSSGSIWVGTLDAGIFQIAKNNKTKELNVINLFDERTDIAPCRVWDIMKDKNNDLWIATDENGVYRYSKKRFQNFSKANGLPNNRILSLFQDKNETIWFGSMGSGLILFQGFQFTHFSQKDGIPGTSVYAVANDKNGNIWIGSNETGLVKATLKNDKLYTTTYYNRNGFESTEVNAISIDKNNFPVVGTKNDGIARFSSNGCKYITTNEGLTSNTINCIYISPKGWIYAGTNNGYSIVTPDKIYAIDESKGVINNEVQCIVADNDGFVWMGTMGGLFRLKGIEYNDYDETDGLTDMRVFSLTTDKNNDIIIGTGNGIFKYIRKTNKIHAIVSSHLNSKTIYSLIFLNDTVLIAGTSLGLNKITFDTNIENITKTTHFDNTNGFKWSENNMNAVCKDKDNNLWFGTIQGLTRYQPKLENTTVPLPVVHITNIRLEFETIDWQKLNQTVSGWFNLPVNLELPYYKNHITFDYTGIYLFNPEKVRYRYKLDNHDKTWSPISKNIPATYPGLNNGEYSFSVISSVDGVNWSQPTVYSFIKLTPPFWKTWWFYTIVVIVFAIAFILFVRIREQKLRKEKEHLEQVVKERTAEVVHQKEQIEHQHFIVSQQKREITDSINYAKRIQEAVLPGVELLKENTADSFILFKPRDIVSGDFYWIGKIDNYLIVAAADCTGHGVPGAFMSMLGVSFLNKIVNEQKTIESNKILNSLRQNIITALKQTNDPYSSKDGMDISLCVLNTKTLEMAVSGANNSLLHIHNNEIAEVKADKMPIGYYAVMNEFESTTITLTKGDCVYLHSDGYQDQMGGPLGRKFMRKNLRELLLTIHQLPFEKQRDEMNNTIENWRKSYDHPHGEQEQIDDIMIIGFKI